MTRERAAEICQYIKFILKNEDYTEEVEEALDMAIKTLQHEQERREDIYGCPNCKGEVHKNYIYCPFCGIKVDEGITMTTHEAIKILRNTAWLGTHEDREKTEQAVEVVAEALEQEQKRGEMTKILDAVKVVRCRECENWKCNPNTKDYGVCGKVSYDDFEVVMEGDDFCSFGIRKREEMTKTLFMNLYNCEKFENLSNGVVYMKIPRCSIYDEIGREWIVNCVRQDNFECCFTYAFEQVERIKGAEQ